MRKIIPLILFILLSGCSLNITVHDEDRAALLVETFLTDIQSSDGTKKAYEWTHEKFKETVTFDKFEKVIAYIRNLNSRSTIKIVGYETLGTEEMIMIYANSAKGTQKIHYQFTLLGTKTKDYRLLNMNLQDQAFKSNGLYREFSKPLEVAGV